MTWKITCYNGTLWYSYGGESLIEAIVRFKKDTELHEMDIKLIESCM